MEDKKKAMDKNENYPRSGPEGISSLKLQEQQGNMAALRGIEPRSDG